MTAKFKRQANGDYDVIVSGVKIATIERAGDYDKHARRTVSGSAGYDLRIGSFKASSTLLSDMKSAVHRLVQSNDPAVLHAIEMNDMREHYFDTFDLCYDAEKRVKELNAEQSDWSYFVKLTCADGRTTVFRKRRVIA